MRFHVVNTPPFSGWVWALVRDGETIAVSGRAYTAERDARAALAEFRRACGGVRFARVLSEPLPGPSPALYDQEQDDPTSTVS